MVDFTNDGDLQSLLDRAVLRKIRHQSCSVRVVEAYDTLMFTTARVLSQREELKARVDADRNIDQAMYSVLLRRLECVEGRSIKKEANIDAFTIHHESSDAG